MRVIEKFTSESPCIIVENAEGTFLAVLGAAATFMVIVVRTVHIAAPTGWARPKVFRPKQSMLSRWRSSTFTEIDPPCGWARNLPYGFVARW